jgi:hypothetical protein
MIVCLVVVQSRALLPFVIYSLRLPKPAFVANSWKSGQSSACRISCGAFIPDKGAHKADVKHGKVLFKRAPFHAASHVTIFNAANFTRIDPRELRLVSPIPI